MFQIILPCNYIDMKPVPMFKYTTDYVFLLYANISQVFHASFI